MSEYTEAKLIMLPCGGHKADKLYSVKPIDGTGDFTTNNTPVISNGVLVVSDTDIFTVSPPAGVTEIIETIGGIEQSPITNIPATYQIPNQNLGSELVVNGGFDTDSDWVKQTGWTISVGTANSDGTAGLPRINQTILTVGKKYIIEFEITAITSGSVNMLLGATNLTSKNTLGIFKQEGVCSIENKFYARSINFVGSIDNVSVKEVLSPSVLINKVIMK